MTSYLNQSAIKLNEPTRSRTPGCLRELLSFTECIVELTPKEIGIEI